MEKIIDCRGLECPKPVILAKKELERLDMGEVTIIVDNDAAKENLQKLAGSLKLTSKVQEKEGFYYITIEKSNNSSINKSHDSNLVILISSDKMGTGDEKLGTALMKSYFYALSECDILPKTLMFVNSGVKLTSEGSEVIENIEKLRDKGVEILSCGTCLDFYNLKEKLLIGSITNMYTIVEKMNNATNTIRL